MRKREGRGWGPFTGGQLTVVIVAICAAFVLTPFAAGAASAVFSNNSATAPAVKATNSNAKGIGISGTGKKYGVYSNGPLGVAAGKSLSCTGCVGGNALAKSAKTFCSGYPHLAIDWSTPGSTPGNGCFLIDANLANANLEQANLTNANLSGTNLTGAYLFGTYFQGARLHGANLSNTKLMTADMRNVHLVNANLTGADLTQAMFNGSTDDTGVIWSNTICPDGSNSDSHGSTCSGYGAP